jgi:hypothetical protein
MTPETANILFLENVQPVRNERCNLTTRRLARQSIQRSSTKELLLLV